MSSKMFGYARVSTNAQDTDRQQRDLLAAGVEPAELFIDHGVSGAKASRPEFDKLRAMLRSGDTLAVTTLDRLGRSTEAMLALSKELQDKGVNLRVLNLGGGDVDTSTPMGNLMFTVMAALAQMELEIKAERNRDSVAKRRAKGGDLGGRRVKLTDDQVHGAVADIANGMSAAAAAAARGVSYQTLWRRAKSLGVELR
ncbi:MULTISPECIES: recombinase family protein [Glutamicibacter]|uniref:recombinase family protein n=1 Tax=Glutamicibacter TaxID=1742989 RepID=UPI0033210D81